VFTAKYTYVNADLAAFYGLPGVTGDTFQKVMLDPATTHRGGLLTQAGVLAGPIHTNNANPVVRHKETSPGEPGCCAMLV
jgi:hypothetical protein